MSDHPEEENVFPIYLDTKFDIAAVSELSHRERSAFKPVYSMNKWWARRSSSVFRSLLIGLALPNTSDLMKYFYSNHQNNPRIQGKIILDPFMGGGTTVVEALRLGYKAIGVDLNPMAWFIVKTETTHVDLESLDHAYKKLENRVAQAVKDLYKTECPCCGDVAQTIYALWAKVAICPENGCQVEVPLFRDYVAGQRRGEAEIRYYKAKCPACNALFDSEMDRANIVHDTYLDGSTYCGNDSNTFWSYALRSPLPLCPCCHKDIKPLIIDPIEQKKKVNLHALVCPECLSVFSQRGEISNDTRCPKCQHRFDPKTGTTDGGGFTCSNGHRSQITDAVNANNGQPLPFRLYAIEGYCPNCAASNPHAEEQLVFAELSSYSSGKRRNHCSFCQAVNHKFFKKPDDKDISSYQRAEQEWERVKDNFIFPREEIHNYEKTNRLIIHNYHYWHELFNSRQLLALCVMLEGILEEADQGLKEALLSAFLGTIEHHNMLNIYYVPYAQSAGAFGRHDFHPKVMACEGNPWGGDKGRGTFLMSYRTVLNGKAYLSAPYDPNYSEGKRKNIFTQDGFSGKQVEQFPDLTSTGNMMLGIHDSRHLDFIPSGSIDHIVTDPPYADAVQYSELSDFFYVWLRSALQKDYPEIFTNTETPKEAEIVENVRRNKSQSDFYQGLQGVFREAYRVLKDNGRLVFTFHHSKGAQWADLLAVLMEAGFTLKAVYPVHSEGTNSGNLVFHSNPNSIAYDIIHVCEKSLMTPNDDISTVRWSQLKPMLFDKVKNHMDTIRSGVEHGQRISPADIRVMLWGECLAIYSRFYGRVFNDDGKPLSIRTALAVSTDFVEELLEIQRPFVTGTAEFKK